jgi:alkylhydroperoxidase family enzyme
MTHPVIVLPDATTDPTPSPDTVWDHAADHYDDKELSSLLVSVAAINTWNRLNAATRQRVPAST